MKKICTKCGVEKDFSEFGSQLCKKYGKTYARTSCKECHRSLARAYHKANHERANAISCAYNKANRFRLALYKAKTAAHRHDHLACTASVEELKAAFTGKCRICGVPEAELNRVLCMDHDHATGEFRGWICHQCNQGLGLFKDSLDVLFEALCYLENSDSVV